MRFKKLAALLCCALMLISGNMFYGITSKADDSEDDWLELNDINFPDENFRIWLALRYDGDGDLKINPDEVTGIYLYGEIEEESIASIEGIQYFSNLESISLRENKISEIDLSKNTKLSNIDLSYNNLSSIDVSNNPELGSLSIEGNNITELDLSNNPKLTYLNARFNQIRKLDFSHNPLLYFVYIEYNCIEELDISNNPKLENLIARSNRLSGIDTSGCPLLKWLDVAFNPMNRVCIINNPDILEYALYIDNTQYVISPNHFLNLHVYTKDKVGEIDFNKIENYMPEFLEGIEDSVGSDCLKYDASARKLSFDFNMVEDRIEFKNDYATGDVYNTAAMIRSNYIGSSLNIVYEVNTVDNHDVPIAVYDGYKFYKDSDGVITCRDENGNLIIDDFKYDGRFTYYFQTDGTAMKDRLTYHPDGEHIIYFDYDGHEVFSNFAHVKHSIEGNEVDDYCFFDVYGHMYVDVLTYDKTGTVLYYANPYGVMEMGKWFRFSDTVMWADGTEAVGIAGGYGYAREDGTLLTNTQTIDWEGRSCYLQGNGVAAY